ncbi:MAG: hypothetical protein QNJ75_04135 [Acidimicrobiia bacterium]|nr:hypothetical protein [Acidimicrobiia bacterium]
MTALVLVVAACSSPNPAATTIPVGVDYDDPEWHQCVSIEQGSMTERGTGEVQLTIGTDAHVLGEVRSYQDSCRPEIFMSMEVTRDRSNLETGEPWLHTLRFWYDTSSGEARLFDSTLYLVPPEDGQALTYSQSTFDDQGWDLAVVVDEYEEGQIRGTFSGGLYQADLESRIAVDGSFDLHPVRFIIPDEGDDTP